MHRTGRGKKDPFHLAVARRRIETLYDLSFAMVQKDDLDMARRYTTLAKRIGMRYTVRIPREFKQFTCKECGVLLVPGRTSRVRVRGGKRVMTCTICGAVKRLPFRRSVP